MDIDPGDDNREILEAVSVVDEHPAFAVPIVVVAETSDSNNGYFDRNPVTSLESRALIEGFSTCATPLNLEKKEDRDIAFDTYVNRAEIAINDGWEIPIIVTNGQNYSTGFASRKESTSNGFDLWIDHYWANIDLDEKTRLELQNVLCLMIGELSNSQDTTIEIDPWDVIGFAFWLKKCGKIDAQTAKNLCKAMHIGGFLPENHNLSVFSFITYDCPSASGRIIASDHINSQCYKHFLLRYFLDTDIEGNLTPNAMGIVDRIEHSGYYFYEVSRYAVSPRRQIAGFRAMKNALKNLQVFSQEGISSFMESTPRILNSMPFFDRIYEKGVTHGIRVGVSGMNNSSKLN